jgi:hypothetical protein
MIERNATAATLNGCGDKDLAEFEIADWRFWKHF